eukprot:gene17903-20392_t
MSRGNGKNGNRGSGNTNNQTARANNSGHNVNVMEGTNNPNSVQSNASTDSNSAEPLTNTNNTREANPPHPNPITDSSINGTNADTVAASGPSESTTLTPVIHGNPNRNVSSNGSGSVPSNGSGGTGLAAQPTQPTTSLTSQSSNQANQPWTQSGTSFNNNNLAFAPLADTTGTLSTAASGATGTAASGAIGTLPTAASAVGAIDSTNRHIGALTTTVSTPQGTNRSQSDHTTGLGGSEPFNVHLGFYASHTASGGNNSGAKRQISDTDFGAAHNTVNDTERHTARPVYRGDEHLL